MNTNPVNSEEIQTQIPYFLEYSLGLELNPGELTHPNE